jgi:transposase
MTHPNSEIKQKIVAAHNSGASIAQLSSLFGYHRNSISSWIKISKASKSFERAKKPGSGRPSKLNGKLGNRLLKIVGKPASQFDFETDFWTTARIQQVCRDELKVKVSRMAIHRTLIKFEHSYKKPQKQYFEACQKKQDAWVRNDLRKIKEVLRKKRGILYFLDESSIQLAPVFAKTWGPIGEKMIQKVTGIRGSISAISAISSSGSLLFNVHEAGKRFKAEDIIKFLEDMLKHHPRRHLVTIMDQAPCHTSKSVKEFISAQKRLHVFYLPPRSPEFNPDKKVWAHLKHNELKSHTAKTTKELQKLVKLKMRSMARDKNKVCGIFRRCEKASIYLL